MKKVKFMSAAVAASFGLYLTTAVAQETTRRDQNPPPQTDVSGVEQNADAQKKADDAAALKPEQTGDQAEKQANKNRLFQVDDLVGAKIRNAKGEDLGEVEEMVVDVNDGSIRYAVVSYGGFLDLGDKLFAVPLKAMSLKSNEDNEAFFVVDIDQQRLEDSKGFDDDDWPNFADPKFASSVNKAYNVQDEARKSDQQGALYKLSTFDGVNVRGADNKELGEIKRILVDAKQAKVAYLAIELEDDVAQNDDDALALIPMAQFTLKTQGDDTFLQTKAAADKIRSAPTATEEQLDDAAKHQELRMKIDNHFGNAKNSDANADKSNADPTNEDNN